MNNRYFGNIHDFCKYGLLRHLANHLQFNIGICWMLTPGAGKPTGAGFEYLQPDNPFRFRRYDSDLFDWLLEQQREWGRVGETGLEWGVGMMEQSSLIRNADFFSERMPLTFSERQDYFRKMRAAFKFSRVQRDIIFLDPDFGMGFSAREFTGERGSGYLHVDEVADCLRDGFSVMFYQDWHRKFDKQSPENRIRTALREKQIRPRILTIEANVAFQGRRAKETGGAVACFLLVQHKNHTVKIEKFAAPFRDRSLSWCKAGVLAARRANVAVLVDFENIAEKPTLGERAYNEAEKRGNVVRAIAAGKKKNEYRKFVNFLHEKGVEVVFVGNRKDEADHKLSAAAIELAAEGKVDEIVVISDDGLFRLDATWARNRKVRYVGIGQKPRKGYPESCDEFCYVSPGRNGPRIRWEISGWD